ncbi:MAG: hypothetical protein ACRD0W_09000 [Acidimicrobiales bacterium]
MFSTVAIGPVARNRGAPRRARDHCQARIAAGKPISPSSHGPGMKFAGRWPARTLPTMTAPTINRAVVPMIPISRRHQVGPTAATAGWWMVSMIVLTGVVLRASFEDSVGGTVTCPTVESVPHRDITRRWSTGGMSGQGFRAGGTRMKGLGIPVRK